MVATSCLNIVPYSAKSLNYIFVTMFTTSVYFIFEVYGRALTIVGLGSEDLVLDKTIFFFYKTFYDTSWVHFNI